MKFDAKKYGYHNLMHRDNKGVFYPEVLTSDHWRKAKGKLCPETGLGKLLDKCEEAFKAIKWETYNARTLRQLDEEEDRVRSWFMGQSVRSYSWALQDVADRAKEKGDEFRKSRTVPKAAGEACQKVFDAADWLTVTLNKDSMNGMLKEAREACRQVRLEAAMKTAEQNIKSADLVRKKLVGELRTIKGELTAWNDKNGEAQLAAVGSALRDLCRDMTQPLGNFLKAQEAGAGYRNFNDVGIKRLFRTMSVVSDSQGWSKVYGGFSKDQMTQEFAKVGNWSKAFILVTNPISMGAR